MSPHRCAVFVLAALLPAAAAADEAAPDAAVAAVADAAENKDASAVRALLQRGCDVNAPQVDGMTALHWAVYHDDLELSELLVGAGADARAANRYDVPPLYIACLNGNGDIVELLLNAGADPQTSLPGGETVLMTASRTGRPGPVEALLARGAEVDATDRKDQTALMWAAAEGNVHVVDVLLSAGADDRRRLSSGFTALFFAVREGRTDAALRLLQAGGDINEPMQRERRSDPGPTPLLLAVENGHFETALALLEAGAEPNARPEGYTALHAITWVRKPLRGDNDPSPVGSGTLTSLDFVRKLVAHGADINARIEDGDSGRARFNMNGSTPFMLAARASDVPLVELLVELGADPDIPNADNTTPLLAAAGVGALGSGLETAGTEEEAIETVYVLLQLGADINAVDDHGETAMHGAAYHGRSKMVRFLAEHGADINVWNRKNEWGWTPLLIAQGHQPGNFQPFPETIVAVEKVMRARGVVPPEAPPRNVAGPDYENDGD